MAYTCYATHCLQLILCGIFGRRNIEYQIRGASSLFLMEMETSKFCARSRPRHHRYRTHTFRSLQARRRIHNIPPIHATAELNWNSFNGMIGSDISDATRKGYSVSKLSPPLGVCSAYSNHRHLPVRCICCGRDQSAQTDSIVNMDGHAISNPPKGTWQEPHLLLPTSYR